MDNTAKVQVVTDVFANGNERYGRERKDNRKDLSPFKRTVVPFQECETIVTDKAGNGNFFEVINNRREVDYFRVIPICRVADPRKDKRRNVTSRHTDNEGDQGQRLLAVVRGDRRYEQRYQTAQNMYEIIIQSRSRRVRQVVDRRTCKAKTDNHDNGANDDRGQKFEEPTRTELFNNQRYDYVDKTYQNHTDGKREIVARYSVGRIRIQAKRQAHRTQISEGRRKHDGGFLLG